PPVGGKTAGGWSAVSGGGCVRLPAGASPDASGASSGRLRSCPAPRVPAHRWGMSTSTETRIPATPTTDDLHPAPDGLEQLRDWVRSQPLGLVHARLHAPSPTFTADELDMVSDAVTLEAIDSIAQWSAEAAALHDFYRRHHSLVTALRELIGEGFRTVADLHHQWKVDTG